MNNCQKNKQSAYILKYQPPSNKNKTSQRDTAVSDNSLIDPIDPNRASQFQPSSDKNKTSQRDTAASSTSLIDSNRASQSQLPSSYDKNKKTPQPDTAASSTSDPNRPPHPESNKPQNMDLSAIQERLVNIRLPKSLKHLAEQEATIQSTRLPTVTYKELLTGK